MNLRDKMCRISDLLQSLRNLSNAHMVDFFTENLWEGVIPQRLRQEKLADDDWFVTLRNALKNNENQCSSFNFDSISLSNYISTLLDLTVPRSELSTDIESIFRAHGLETDDKLTFDRFATAKKMHEVETLAEIIVSISKKFSINKVIDVGSGKGYLGSYLALRHNLWVVGVDSSSVNSEGAAKRDKKMQKTWSGYVRRAEQRKAGIIPTKKGKHWKAKTESVRTNRGNPIRSQSPDLDLTPNNIQESNVDSKSSTKQNNDSTSTRDRVLKEGLFIPIMENVNRNTTLEGILKKAQWTLDTEESFLLAGLHTCGDLAANTIELFLSNPQIKVLCNVGCCYHLIEEKYSKNPYSLRDSAENNEYGFPLSETLDKKQYSLGRNSRMLACESLDRMLDKSKPPNPALFYRALLQVILQSKYPSDKSNGHVGRLGLKCKGFIDYVQKAFKHLDLDPSVITESEILELCENYETERKKLESFYQLRTLLAPVLESLILIDRLCYLQEQDCVEFAYLTRLFDPVTSPRCYAIIAIKK